MIKSTKTIICLMTSLLFVSSTFAQKNARIAAKDTITDNNIMVPEMLNSDVDDSLINWFGQKITPDANCSQSGQSYSYSDQDYINRLAKLPTVMEMPYNQVVRSYIDLYAERRRGQVSSMLGLSKFYFPMFEEELAKNSMPLELKYLPIIESALNPVALSRAGASGLWQFMYPTGKMFGLNVNSFVDERRDPIKSTQAAVKYLKELYDVYGDWHLAIAAYNCGPGNVNKAIRRANGQKDYWVIYNNLPRETRGYVPAFIAATYIMNYYQDHGICPAQTQLTLVTDTVHVDEMVHFQQISEILSVPVDEIRALNPQYKIDIIPGNTGTQTLRLPMDAALAFECNKDSICAYRANDFLVNNRRIVSVGGSSYSSGSSESGSVRTRTVVHKVRSGETLSKIANRYGITVSELKSWNRLRSNSVKRGQSLRIRIETVNYSSSSQKSETETAEKVEKVEKVEVGTGSRSLASIVQNSGSESSDSPIESAANKVTTSTPSSSPERGVQVSEKKEQPSTKANTSKKAKSYKVKRGDTLSGIAEKNGVSMAQLKKLNNISNSNIRIGQVLRLP